MITTDSILSVDAGCLPVFASALTGEDIGKLIGWLNEKDDKIRYRSFLLLQHRSASSRDAYAYWDDFRAKLKSDNSYQRSIGMMLLAENARWDNEGRTQQALKDCLPLLNDERPITVRQCVQSLEKIARSRSELGSSIAAALLAVPLKEIRETMRKSVLLDIVNALLEIRKRSPSEEIDAFLLESLTGNFLDSKAKRILREAL